MKANLPSIFISVKLFRIDKINKDMLSYSWQEPAEVKMTDNNTDKVIISSVALILFWSAFMAMQQSFELTLFFSAQMLALAFFSLLFFEVMRDNRFRH